MRALLAMLMLAMVVAACGDSTAITTTAATTTVPASAAPSAPDSTTTSSTSSSTTTVASTAGPTTTVEAAIGATVVVYEGQVDGPGRLEVKQGELVVLSFESDVSDEIHVHGYDLFAAVNSGGVAEISFNADIPGIFEVELEDAGLEVLELVVQP